MSTATAPSKPSLDADQLEWLKIMGAALDVQLKAGPPADASTSAAGAPKPAVGADGKPQADAAKPAGASPAPSDADKAKFHKEILKVGSKGPAVEHLQNLLNDNGAKIEVDGKFGPITQKAVKDFQTSHPPLKADGVVGPQTWAALEAGKPKPPPPPPDTKPRTAVFIVTDAATNNAVKGAVVKLGDKSERTGDTGQATISIPPGSYPFGVTADGFEQAVDTIEVTSGPETQKRVELKGGEKRTTTVLTVSPSGKSKNGDKLELTATVTLGDGKVKPTGTVRFDVVLNKTGGRQAIKDLVPLKDGKAVHVDTLLPGGTHLLDATFKPDGKDVGSQSAPVEHAVEQTTKDKNVQTGTKLFGTKGSKFASIAGSDKMTVPQQKTIFDDLLKKKIENVGAAKELSEEELKQQAEQVAKTVNKLAEVDLGTKTNQMIEKSPTLKAKVVELKAEYWTIKKGEPGKGSFCDRDNQIIVIDPNDSEEDIATGLAHEVGHGTYNMPPKASLKSTKDGETYILKNVERTFTDEGNAQFVACEVVAELKAKGVTTVAPADAAKTFQGIYDKFVAKTITKDKAVLEMAKQFKNLTTSNTHESYFQYYGKGFMGEWNDANPADKKVTALPSQDKLFK